MPLTPEQLPDLLQLLRLKNVPRTGWTRHPIGAEEIESVADHSFGVILLAWLLCPDHLNKTRVLELALVHDLAEVKVGDLTPHCGVSPSVKRKMEAEALRELTGNLAKRADCARLFEEYQQQESEESRWVKAMDKLEMTLQSLNYEKDHPVDLKEFRLSASEKLKPLGLAWLVEEGRSST